jgi:hypothetical protein
MALVIPRYLLNRIDGLVALARMRKKAVRVKHQCTRHVEHESDVMHASKEYRPHRGNIAGTDVGS